MQKKKCPILQIIGFVVVVAAVIVALPKVIQFVKEKFAKDDVDDMEFEFEEEESEFVKPEPMEKEPVKSEEDSEEAASEENTAKDDIFVEE